MIDDIEISIVNKKTGTRRTLRISTAVIVIGLLVSGILLTMLVGMYIDLFRQRGLIAVLRTLLLGVIIGAPTGHFLGRWISKQLLKRLP